MVTYLCKSGCCPAVELHVDGVVIGETGNQCRLSKDEWNALLAKVKAGELREL